MRNGGYSRFYLAAALSGFVYCVSALTAAEETALDRYIAKPDPNYSYRLVRVLEQEGIKAHVLEMTSQKWLTEEEVDKPLWKHWVTIMTPDKPASRTGLLLITGGSNDKPAPDKLDQNLLRVAATTESVVTELRMVPNQPLVFHGKTGPLYEDALIAYTWDQYLRSGDERWPARLPMTKSAVRAMDTVTDFCASEQGGQHKVDTFVIAGASKRGWTTWSTAAVDKRVVAIVPIVIDILNVIPSFVHHHAAYGFWAPAVKDYVQMGIMNWMNTPEFKALMKIEEPYEYRARLKMPKLIINSAGDQFFLPDSSQFYWRDLPGKNYLRYVPNSDHSLKNTDALTTLTAYYDAILKNKDLPEFDWSLPEPGVIRVSAKTRPSRVKLWQATNATARDFRLDTIGPAYRETNLESKGNGIYEARLESPPQGWTAGFIELTYDGDPAPLKFTTGITVVPDVLPFKGKFVPEPIQR